MQEINEIVKSAEKSAQEGNMEQALEIFLDAIDGYRAISEELEDEAVFQMGWFLFGHHFYIESIEIWKKLQEKGCRQEEIGRIVEEAFIAPNEKQFQAIYEENLKTYKKQIHTEKIYEYQELPYRFIPVEDGYYYLFDKDNRQIINKVTVLTNEYPDQEIFQGENAFDTIVFWKNWDYVKPIQVKQRNSRQAICLVSESGVPFSYLQLPELENIFKEKWYMFDNFDSMKDFFHIHGELSLPRLFQGEQKEERLIWDWVETEHKFRCSKEGRNRGNILLTIGIPSYNRGHRALENIKHLQEISYDSEIEFLVCDNCSQVNVEGYREIERLAEQDNRITYYRFPENPGGNLSFAETVERASGKFCCMLSDEDLIYLDNVWKYLYLIQKYGETLGFINAAGKGYYSYNDSKWYQKGGDAFEKVFWALNYLSGCIFGTELHRKLGLHKFYEWQKENGEGNFFNKSYAHNSAAMRCALERDVYICGEMLFCEGEDEFVRVSEDPEKKRILDYARADLRIKQLQGLVELLNEWKDMLSPKIIKDSYSRAVNKLFILINMILEENGTIERSFQDAYDYILRASVKGIETLDVELHDREYADMVSLFSFWYIKFSRLCREKGKESAS